MLLLKVAIPVLLGAGLLGLAFAGEAGAKELPPALPADLKKQMEKALDAGDPVAMRVLAGEIEKAGFKAQADSLRDAAAKIEAEMRKVKPLPEPTTSPGLPPVVRTPSEQPKRGADVFKGGQAGTVTATPSALTYVVRDGDFPGAIAKRLTGNERRWPELIAANPQKQTKQTKIGKVFTTMHAGEVLKLPESWREALPKVEGDEPGDRPARRIAGRAALEIASSRKGSENRELIASFQQLAKSLGADVNRMGLFDHLTAIAMATLFGIVPPLKFADGRDIYWPVNPAPAKRAVRNALDRLANADPAREEEWRQASKSI